ncbi:MAG: hypothetical protein ACFFBP_10050 [Promethearchaeota archaeon]
MAPLEPYGYVQGSLTLAFTAVSIILGVFMILKYIKYKDRQLLFVAISWILLITPWWPDTISFVSILIGGGNDIYQLPNEYYFLIANALVAPIFYTWIDTFSKLVLRDKPKQRKAITWFFIIWAIVFEIIILTIYFLMLFYDPIIMGVRISAFYVEWNPIIAFYLMSASLIFTLTGLIFSAQTLKSPEPSIRLKGIFLMIAFVTFTIGIIFEILLTIPELLDIAQISLVFARVFGIIAALSFYIGFVLPNFIKRLLLKQ